MRLILLLVAFVATSFTANSQILTPVKWASEYEHISGDEYNLKFTAKVDKGWWIYAQESSPDGPIPTSFNYDSGAHYSLVGKTKESAKKQKEGKEPLFLKK